MAEKTGVIVVEASKKVDGEDRKGAGKFNAGETVQEAIELYGGELVHDFFIRSAKIKMQSQMRAELEAGTFEDGSYDEWRPDEDRTPSRDPISRIKSDLNKLDADERADFIASLKADLGIE